MNNKRMIISMALLMAFMLLWNPMWDWLAKKNNWKVQPDPPKTAQVAPAPVATDGATTHPTTGSTTGPSSRPTTGSSMSAAPAVVALTTGEHTTTSIGFSEYDLDGTKSTYPVGVKLTTRGAGVESVELNRYKKEVSVQEPYIFQKPYGTTEYATPLATRSVSINGGPAVALWALDWKLVAPAAGSTAAASSASFTTDVPDAAGNRIAITKTYSLQAVKPKEPAPGYEMSVTYTFKNPTGQPVKVKTAYNGPTVPLAENTRDITNLVMGYDADASVAFKFEATTSLKGTPLDLKVQNPHTPLWFGFSSNYFNAIVRPVDAQGKPLGFEGAKAESFSLNPDAKEPLLKDSVIALETPDIIVPANGESSFKLQVFVGPKLRAIINDPIYSQFPTGYDATLVMSGFCGFCARDWMINSLVWLLNSLHYLFHDWGLAIIGLVLIVRLALHPVTKRSQVSMSKMTKLGPEMERLKKKYGDDKEGLQKAQIQLTKEQGIAPILGCLPMFLQMPIWIALWSCLQSTFEIRHAPFLWGHTWIKDLAQPDKLLSLKEPVNLWFVSVSALNVLPILMGVIFWAQQKFMPQPTAMNPEQAQQQKMMKWMMPFMMPIFLYSSPSGLNLYILTSTAIGIFESKRVRDHIKEQEDKEKAGLVIVDLPPDKDGGSTGSGTRRLPGSPPAPTKKGFLGTLMERAQKMAEDAQKNAKAQQGQPPKKKNK